MLYWDPKLQELGRIYFVSSCAAMVHQQSGSAGVLKKNGFVRPNLSHQTPQQLRNWKSSSILDR